MSNRSLGNRFEHQFCQRLFDDGWWVHNLTQNKAGQPADVITVKNGKAYLIDCKVCTKGRFQLSRIEPNQITAMRFWKQCGNTEPYFALENDSNVIMVEFDKLYKLIGTKSSLKWDEINEMGTTIERWLNAN